MGWMQFPSRPLAVFPSLLHFLFPSFLCPFPGAKRPFLTILPRTPVAVSAVTSVTQRCNLPLYTEQHNEEFVSMLLGQFLGCAAHFTAPKKSAPYDNHNKKVCLQYHENQFFDYFI